MLSSSTWGAEGCFDYAHDDPTQAVRKYFPEGADLVLDAAGGESLTAAIGAVRPGGHVVSIVDLPDPAAIERAGASASTFLSDPDGDQLAGLGLLFDQKKLRVHVQKIYPLSAAADAHSTLEQRHVQGKLVLNL